jgi:hypothetical protein
MPQAPSTVIWGEFEMRNGGVDTSARSEIGKSHLPPEKIKLRSTSQPLYFGVEEPLFEKRG